MRIYYQIWGPLPPEISTYILWHDAGELVTGDLPFPIKKNSSPEFRETLHFMEAEAVENMGGTLNELITVYQAYQVKVCDLIEMLEFGFAERLLGNIVAEPIIVDVQKVITEVRNKLDGDDNRRVTHYMDVSHRGRSCT